jgi:hypothetical protein
MDACGETFVSTPMAADPGSAVLRNQGVAVATRCAPGNVCFHAPSELGKRRARYGVEATPDSVAAFAKKHLGASQIKKVVEGLSKK